MLVRRSVDLCLLMKLWNLKIFKYFWVWGCTFISFSLNVKWNVKWLDFVFLKLRLNYVVSCTYTLLEIWTAIFCRSSQPWLIFFKWLSLCHPRSLAVQRAKNMVQQEQLVRWKSRHRLLLCLSTWHSYATCNSRTHQRWGGQRRRRGGCLWWAWVLDGFKGHDFNGGNGFQSVDLGARWILAAWRWKNSVSWDLDGAL